MTPSIGLDVHQATISATVLDSAGKLVMGSSYILTVRRCTLCGASSLPSS